MIDDSTDFSNASNSVPFYVLNEKHYSNNRVLIARKNVYAYFGCLVSLPKPLGYSEETKQCIAEMQCISQCLSLC